MPTEPASVKRGSWASSKDYTLPEDVVAELQKNESLDQLLDRYLPTVKLPRSQPTSPSSKNDAVESAFMTALLKEPDSRTANSAPAHSTSNDATVE